MAMWWRASSSAIEPASSTISCTWSSTREAMSISFTATESICPWL